MNDQRTKNSPCCGGVCESQAQAVRPSYRTINSDTGVTLELALPGVRKEDVEISFRESLLTVKARRETIVPDGWTPRQETPRPEGYELCVRLHSTLNPSAAEAELQDGILRLKIARREEALPRQISVT